MLCNKSSIVSLCSNSGTSVHCPRSCSNSGYWHFCYYQQATQQYAGWTLDHDCNSCQKLYFADSLGRKTYGFFKQQYEQMMPKPLQSHHSVCGFYTIYSAFHLFKFRQEKITGVHDANVLSFISNYMFSLYVNVQFMSCFCPILYILIKFFKLLHKLST